MSPGHTNILLGHLRHLLSEQNSSIINEFAALLPTKAAPLRQLKPTSLPVVSWLPHTHENCGAPAKALIGHLLEVADTLSWGQTYGASDFGDKFLRGYGWSEFIGQRGPIQSDKLACGILFLGPNIEYPRHCHAAEEIYIPLSGRAQWLKGDQGWIEQSPMSLIHHTSYTPHAMRTQHEPLLALYMWRDGNLTEKSTIG